MSRAARTILTVVGIAVLAAGAYLSVTRATDDDGAEPEGPPPTAPPPNAGAALREITVEGALRLRWSTETDRGAQPDLVLVMADNLEVRSEGPQVRYRVDDESFFCFSTGADSLTCEVDPTPSELVPVAGTTRYAANIAEPRVIAGRDASCWAYTAEATTTESCVDDATEVLVFSETVDSETGTMFRQTLVEWESASVSDVELPPEVAALVE